MPDKRPTISGILRASERMLYYVAALALIVMVGVLVVSTAIDVPTLLRGGAFRTAITILDRVLLLFIFAELLHSIKVILEEDRILVEPFLLIGIIAVIRQILIASVETTLSGPPRISNA